MSNLSQRLIHLRKSTKQSQQELANNLGLTRSAISMYEADKRVPPLEVLEIFADYYNVDMDYLIGKSEIPNLATLSQNEHEKISDLYPNGNPSFVEIHAALGRKFLQRQSESDLLPIDHLPNIGDTVLPSISKTLIPILGKVAAGVPIEAVEEILGHEEISRDMAANGEYFALRIKGESMAPKMSDGDIVIVRRQPDVDNGQTAVVLVNGDEATVKRIKKSDAGIMLMPTNPAYEPMFYSNDEIERLPVTIIGRVVELRAKL